MIVAIEGLIPDRLSARRADSARNKLRPFPREGAILYRPTLRKERKGCEPVNWWRG
jgi:hypothetical protein